MSVETIGLTSLELTRFFFAIVLLLIFAHACGFLFQRKRLPRVVGEIVGGLLLGPSVLGFLVPGLHAWAFAAFPEEGKLIGAVYWIGLVLLMFVTGFEIERQVKKQDRTLVVAVLLGSTLLPFLAGWLLPGFLDVASLLGPADNLLALQLVIAIAVAVTSIPVISRIFLDLGMLQTRFATVVLVTATIHDVVLWVALAVATGLVSATTPSLGSTVLTVGVTLAFFLLSLTLFPRLVRYGSRRRENVLLKASPTGYLLVICFLFAAVASVLQVNIIFGAFLAGIVVGILPQEQFAKEKGHIKEMSLAFFIPLYFAIVGFRLDLIHAFDPLFFLGFLLFVTLVQGAGTFAASRVVKQDTRSALHLAIAMNARGGPGIILATVAFDLGIISESFFVTLVLTAIVTSLLAGWWFRRVIASGQPLLKE